MKTNLKSLIGFFAGVALFAGACSDDKPSTPTPADTLVGSYVGTVTIGSQVNKNVNVAVSLSDSVVIIDAGQQTFDSLAVLLDIVFTTKDLTEVNGPVWVGGTSSTVKGTAFNVASNQVTQIGSLGTLTMTGTPYCTIDGRPYHGVGGSITVFGVTGNKLSVSLIGVIQIINQSPRTEPITIELSKR
ncbi:MAG: hypothetical protein LBK47_01000 [Prevotellaceae bacterium]|jgi:hypothetical protein|nr:hypothetical protein [Prevotellaceae bacterium]